MKTHLPQITALLLGLARCAIAGEPHLVLDLDAAAGVQTDAKGKVLSWSNNAAGSPVGKFVPNDAGRKEPGSGMPSLLLAAATRPFPVVEFHHQELINENEDAFDKLTQQRCPKLE